MSSAILAAVAALAGVVVARLLDARGESTAWLREHRSVAYAAFIGAAERYLTAAREVGHADPKVRMSHIGQELDRIFGDLQLFGTESAGVAAAKLRARLYAVETTDDPDEATRQYEAAKSALLSLMHRELHVP